MSISDVIVVLNKYSGLLAVLVALVPIVWLAFDYLKYKRAILEHQRYEHVKKALSDLADKSVTSQEQLLAISELVNHEKYHDIIYRIFDDIYDESLQTDPFHRELKISMELIKSKNKNL
ncbi:hypothetical protein FCV43_18915 [Vibrio genomosp. F6]|nr:hypothetical protein FCV43_18915 [Vibrio genomosp. F6]